MESRMEESILNHGVAISRIEDCKDDMNVCKNDIDTLKLERVLMGRDIRMLEGVMGGTQEDLENVSSQVDSFVLMTRRTSALVEGNARFLAEVQRGQLEVCGLAENLNQKFVKVNNIIDKIVRQDEEMDRAVELVGQKIDAKMGEFSSDLMEALEIEENRRKDLKAKVAFLEEKLVNSLTHMSNLMSLILSVQARVAEVEDAVMEEDDDGEVVFSSFSDLDPVENMVAIPVPAPFVLHMLVGIPEEFVPPILQPSSAVLSTPSPEYVQALEDDPVHNGTPESLGARVPGFWWEHAEYIAGIETLCPAFAQQEHLVHIWNVIWLCVPNVPIGNISFTAGMRPCHVSEMYPPRTFQVLSVHVCKMFSAHAQWACYGYMHFV
jgi:hypothetical protein